MPKTNIEDIFPNWKNFKIKKLNPSDAKLRKQIENVKRQQAECLKRKQVDWSQLNNFYITI